MKVKVFLALICVVSALSSCSTKTSAIKDLSSLQQEIEVNGQSYTINDWKKAKDKYEKINESIIKHKDEYTAEEYEEIGVLQGKCIASFAKSVTGSLMNKITNAASAVKGILEGLKE